MSVAATILRFAEGDEFNVAFKEQIDFFRQKVSLPSKTWRDIDGRAHDRAFVVAGVEKEQVLADIRRAVDDAIAKGKRLEEFRAEFDGIVAKHGWIGGAGEKNQAWRARVIYETNVRTSYMAGRLAQMRDPDVLALRPYWQYVHADIRVPEVPRPDHVSWDGIVLMHDDPWWTTHFPPNGWLCSCGVRPLSKREMERVQEKRGKAGVDKAPPLALRPVKDPKTGEMVMVPEGIDFGWDHMPGDTWQRGLVPPEQQQPLDPSDRVPPGQRSQKPPADLPPLAQVAKPLEAPRLPPNQPPEKYADAFLKKFGAERGQDGGTVYRDASGHAVVISEELLKNQRGEWKVTKRERAREMEAVAEAIKDPDEIWVDWEWVRKTARHVLRRRYIRWDSLGRGLLAVFEWGVDGWSGKTAMSTDDPKKAESYAEAQRHGALIYRREKK